MTWHWQSPGWLYLLLLVPALIGLHVWTLRKGKGSLRFSDLGLFDRVPPSWTVHFRHLPFAFRMLALVLLIVALALYIFIVKFLGWIMRSKKEEAAAAPPPPTADQVLLAEIRDLLKTGKA